MALFMEQWSSRSVEQETGVVRALSQIVSTFPPVPLRSPALLFSCSCAGPKAALREFNTEALSGKAVYLRPLRELYADTLAAEFGPRALKAVRQKMLDAGWCRPYINKQVNRVRHIFKWAVSDELLPGSVLHGLQSVPGLRKGRSDASEPDPQDLLVAWQGYIDEGVDLPELLLQYCS